MDANDFFVWYGLDAKRVRLAKVRLLGKGQLLKFFLCGDVCDVNAVELFGIKRRAVFKGLELLGNKLKLRGLHLHGFVLALTGGECGDGGNGHINGAIIEPICLMSAVSSTSRQLGTVCRRYSRKGLEL